MKIGTVVRIALIMFIFSAGNIFLVEILGKSYFEEAYFLFILALIGLIIWWKRGLFTRTADFVFIILLALAMSASIAFFAGSLKNTRRTLFSSHQARQQGSRKVKTLLHRPTIISLMQIILKIKFIFFKTALQNCCSKKKAYQGSFGARPASH